MEIKALVKKLLPVKEGEGRNGHYEIHPMIIEWDEVTPSGGVTHSAVVEFNANKFDVKQIAKLAGTDQTLDLYLGLDVDDYNEKYYNRVIVYCRDAKLRIGRQY